MELSEKTKRNFFILLWAGFLIPVIAAFVILFMIGTDNLGYVPDFEELENPKSSLASQIISADRVLLGKFYKENRTTENRFNNIPDNIKAALLATEDVRFYEHYGIDLQSLFRVAKGLVTRNTSSGGGSTISQQLAKNLYNMRDHKRPKGLMGKIVMKLQEWVTAVKLERRYCKEEIMSMYLNTVGFGHNAFGIEAAAKTFFDTKPVQITSLTENENISNVTFIKHLMCLPGISERIAIAIVKEYPKLDLLYNMYLSDEYDEKEKESLLENIQIGNKRLGPALSAKIYKFFTADKPDIKINN